MDRKCKIVTILQQNMFFSKPEFSESINTPRVATKIQKKKKSLEIRAYGLTINMFFPGLPTPNK